MSRIGARLGDPFVASLVLAALLSVGGLTSLWLGWRNSARISVVAGQLPHMVSGSLAGVAMVVFAAAILTIQHRRRLEALDQRDFERVIEAARCLVEAKQAADLRREPIGRERSRHG